MKHRFAPSPLAFDRQAITDTIQRALASAGLDTTAGPMHDVTETIRQALGSGPLGRHATSPGADRDVIDVPARVVGADTAAADAPAADATAGQFTSHRHSGPAGTRSYKLYVPATPAGGRAEAMPVVVMLHGCTQSADDFARGTRMNRLADRHGVLVVYPEQDASANPSSCWNWFNPQDQQRERGEPAVLAGIVQEVTARHAADPTRVYVAGLSAGAAMAVILGEAYPDRFAAVGAHSGLPFGSAHDVGSALAAMKGGRRGGPVPASAHHATRAVPTIVFHGDRDHTVQQKNGARIVEQARAAFEGGPDGRPLRVVDEPGSTPAGRRFERSTLVDSDGRVQIEQWTVHGAGHAWSGGDAAGSYTDASGPDASAEMLRFFLTHRTGGTA